MRLDDERESENVEDRRAMSPGRMVVGGGLGTIILVLLASFITGADPRALLQRMGQQQQAPAQQGEFKETEEEKQQSSLVRKTLGLTEDVWAEIFAKAGKRYQPTRLVLFRNQVTTDGCGMASTAVGPFYCPADQKVYIDLAFYEELANKFKAPGQFAQAYVIAHEVGHHVQNLLGISEKVSRMQQQVGELEGKKLSVMLELQADYLAGVWAHHAEAKRHILEEGDIESGLNAASQIGDDKLQKRAQGYVVPDSFTHGSAAQRVKWFRKGLVSGDINGGDTFSAPDL
ncbi:KPN_02809 family neutral zinc metallopeptidase [Aquisphaera insulae]|uniref:KPN_02809 family neutral zinc metallopeptidase n=1 Tax=Aquisphaera insulae TaxID=2712864 RepID=UPI0013E9AFEA|nr:neutral zinc metallopeptidase [Aquisphaera insulae]